MITTGTESAFDGYPCGLLGAGPPGSFMIYANKTFTEAGNMTLLIPDRNKESQEDFIWALPAEHAKWQKWYELSKKFKATTPMGVRYMSRVEDKEIKTIVLLPTEEQTDDEAKTAAAWLRMVKQLSCRIYVIRAAGEYAQPMNKYELINAVVGIDPDTLTELEEDDDAQPNT